MRRSYKELNDIIYDIRELIANYLIGFGKISPEVYEQLVGIDNRGISYITVELENQVTYKVEEILQGDMELRDKVKDFYNELVISDTELLPIALRINSGWIHCPMKDFEPMDSVITFANEIVLEKIIDIVINGDEFYDGCIKRSFQEKLTDYLVNKIMQPFVKKISEAG
jgi:hypothetical protein